MAKPPAMSTPVTYGQLRREFDAFETRFEAKLDQKLDQKLGLWGGALFERMMTAMTATMTSAMAAMEQRMLTEIAHQASATEQRMYDEMARHTRAIGEQLGVRVAVIDEKYADLPARVTRLEQRAEKRTRR